MITPGLSVVAALIALVTAVIYLRDAHRQYDDLALVPRIAIGMGMIVLGAGILVWVATIPSTNAPALAVLAVLFALVALDANRGGLRP